MVVMHRHRLSDRVNVRPVNQHRRENHHGQRENHNQPRHRTDRVTLRVLDNNYDDTSHLIALS